MGSSNKKGCILLSRAIIESEIWDKPPLYIKVWVFLLIKAQHKDFKGLKRGQLYTSIPEIQDACSWHIGYRKERPSKDRIYNIIQWLRKSCEGGNESDTSTTMITTTKATHGTLVNIDNYSIYQDMKYYKSNNVDNDEKVKKKLQEQHSYDNINKNVNNGNNDNNNISIQKQIFDYWILKANNEKALVKHKNYTDTFEKAINRTIKICGKDIDKLKSLIDRFVICYDESQDTDYPIRSRPFYEFFGQKVKGGVNLICQEYDDDGSKWLRYCNSPKKKKTVFD